jgi:hypothetical protein
MFLFLFPTWLMDGKTSEKGCRTWIDKSYDVGISTGISWKSRILSNTGK